MKAIAHSRSSSDRLLNNYLNQQILIVTDRGVEVVDSTTIV
ncbi:MAG: hypothetical protein RM022_029045 [Nostoc sp. EfeVER01]